VSSQRVGLGSMLLRWQCPTRTQDCFAQVRLRHRIRVHGIHLVIAIGYRGIVLPS
jgi:hypothetical protein